jgi:hypothetical protein
VALRSALQSCISLHFWLNSEPSSPILLPEKGEGRRKENEIYRSGTNKVLALALQYIKTATGNSMFERIKKKTGLSRESSNPRRFNRWMWFFMSIFFIAAFFAIYLTLSQKPIVTILSAPAATAVETPLISPKFLRTPVEPLPTTSLWDNGND